jgi:hypothetical protein
MSQWEIGTGAYTASTKTFARTTINANSLGTTAKINFSATRRRSYVRSVSMPVAPRFTLHGANRQ